MKKHYLVGYDIADPKRLGKLAKLMTSYGTRVQYSFFHCAISDRQKKKMKDQIGAIVKEDEDQVIILPVAEKQLQEMECIGYGVHLEAEGIIIV